MFDKSILTVNLGLDSNAQPLREFTDIRGLQYQLKDRGISILAEAEETFIGPASLIVIDPDGNTI